LYFAGVLRLAKEVAEPKYLDYEIGYAPPTGEHVTDDQAPEFLSRATDEIRALTGSLSAMMEPAVQERAFGAAGEPGDPARIKRLAERWNSIYTGMLEWAARVRGAGRGDLWNHAFDLVADLASDSIQSYRQFVADYVTQVDRIPSALASQEPLVISMTLKLTIRDGLTEELEAELDRIRGEL
jgi:hypothetical protein